MVTVSALTVVIKSKQRYSELLTDVQYPIRHGKRQDLRDSLYPARATTSQSSIQGVQTEVTKMIH